MKKTKVALMAMVVLLLVGTNAKYTSALGMVQNSSWWSETSNPRGLTERDVANLEALLSDIALHNPESSVHFIAIRSLESAGEGTVNLTSLRNNYLNEIGRGQVASTLTTVIIWSSAEQLLHISIPEKINHQISRSVVNTIVEDELIIPLLFGSETGSALFDTISRLARYIVLATETGIRKSQVNLPEAFQYPHMDTYRPEDLTPTSDVSSPGERASEENRFVIDSPPPPPAHSSRSNPSPWVIGTVMLIVLLAVAFFLLRRKRQREDYYDDYGDYDDQMYDDYEDFEDDDHEALTIQ